MGIVVWQNCAQNVFSWHGKSCGIMLADRRRMLCWILNLIWAQILKIFWLRPQKYCVLHLHQNSKSSTSLVSPKKPSIHNNMFLNSLKALYEIEETNLVAHRANLIWAATTNTSSDSICYYAFRLKTSHIFAWKPTVFFAWKPTTFFAWKPPIYFAWKPTI